VTPSSRSRLALVAALALIAATTACSADKSDSGATTTSQAATPTTTTIPAPQRFDIVGTALTAAAFTELAGLVVDAGLVDTLREPGPFTVFAPTNAAFKKLPVDALHAVQADPKLLSTVLAYHVVPGALKLADLTPGKLKTVAGIDLNVTRDGDTVLINGFPISSGDIEATNGIIHVMSDVLLPPS
jgi:uncharacterized surface protein with fasciclin (FAS1) repeats